MDTLQLLRNQLETFRRTLGENSPQYQMIKIQFDHFIEQQQNRGQGRTRGNSSNTPPASAPSSAPAQQDPTQQFLDHLQRQMADRGGIIGFTPERAKEMVDQHPDLLKQVDEYNEALKKQMEEQERNRKQMLDRLGIADCDTGDFALDLVCAMRGTTKSVLTAPVNLLGDFLGKSLDNLGSSLLTSPLFILAAIGVGAYAIGQLKN